MKSTWPPPQVILVGLESNQQGHAASHEQASSSWPVIFHGVLSFGSSAALAVEAKQKNVTASTPNDDGKSDVVFMVRILTASRVPDKTILWCCSRHPAGDAMRRCLQISAALRTAKRLKKNQRVTRLELATSSLARRCSTTELHPRFEREEIMSSGRRDATFLIAPPSGIFE